MRDRIEASHGFTTKNKKSRQLPLTAEISALFAELLKEAKQQGKAGPNDFVFVTPTGRRIIPNRFTREAKKVMKRVLGRNSGAVHIWRHSALTLMLQKGADIETVRKVAGHSSLTVTQRYCHSNDVAMERAIEGLQTSVHFWKNWAIGLPNRPKTEK